MACSRCIIEKQHWVNCEITPRKLAEVWRAAVSDWRHTVYDPSFKKFTDILELISTEMTDQNGEIALSNFRTELTALQNLAAPLVRLSLAETGQLDASWMDCEKLMEAVSGRLNDLETNVKNQLEKFERCLTAVRVILDGQKENSGNTDSSGGPATATGASAAPSWMSGGMPVDIATRRPSMHVASPKADNPSKPANQAELVEEICDIVFEAPHAANGNGIRMMIEEEKTVLALVEHLKSLETPDGRRCYSHDFMMVAAKLPSSKTRPMFETNIGPVPGPKPNRKKWSKERIDEVFNLNRQASKGKLKRQTPATGAGFAQSWMSAGMPMDMPIRSSYPSWLSDPISVRHDRGGKGSLQHPGLQKQPALVMARPSIDLELTTAGNSCKPVQKAEIVEDPDRAETNKLLKEVQDILNKITPRTLAELSAEFLDLEPRMNTTERVSGVVDIVFQKAVDEPAFCSLYSELCDRMYKYQVALQRQSANDNDQQLPTNGFVNAASPDRDFRRILLDKCQREFEKVTRTETSWQEREAALESAETAEQKKQLQIEFEEFMMKKRRAFGTMRFIGELYLRKRLPGNIIHRCIKELMKSEDEESLECLCILLTTIGAKLDVDDKSQSEAYYTRLKTLSPGLSDRVRFMILDLLELRANSWKPRQKGERPNTHD